ncbi:MAG: hypothetical protein OEY44_03455 [Candidatus Peregrinibacteria bacterium]|nr:hypothetical protein [Candidatus Peregrinibacteria bacterium]
MNEEVKKESEEEVVEQPVQAEGEAEPATEATPEAEAPKKAEPEKERDDITTLHERTIAALSYFGFMAIVPFYLKKDSEFCRFHGKQGMLLAVFFFLTKLFTVIDLVFDLMLILQVAMLFIMGFAALSGRWKKLPFGYDWACQLEDALTLKTKQQEEDEIGLKPNVIKAEAETKESK